MASAYASDCRECGSTRSVVLGMCDICFADFGERAAPAEPLERPSIPREFASSIAVVLEDREPVAGPA